MEVEATPLWKVIAAGLRADILEARYTPGSPLPSETALAERYNVSRPTVRDAVKALVLEGLITVIRGRGTFVRPVPDRYVIMLGVEPRHDIASSAYNSEGQNQGWLRWPIPDPEEPEVDVYGFSTVLPADRETAMLMGLRTGHSVVRRYSVWFHAKVRTRIEVSSFINADLIPDFTRADLVGELDAVYRHLEKGRGPVSWADTVTARMPYENERERLEIEAGAPILLIRRIMYSRDGQVLEMTEIRGAAEHYETTSVDVSSDQDQSRSAPKSAEGGRVILAL
ncbi:GntR family transcriptional regulator [Herbidospora sp. NBRC 101105]|uniref:GntR family transcriptional regulator n=1 Tax=Herbidospora sp. NBRC 101105 TaxID=3032195 RepID=UPI00249FC54A|nr:GntR family transcriptional regulator [Herbidospora sp. NBRC 101105]GLX94832.1 GntR family transcriptional regulator [Herbidospora sp. NBRC 101105]